MEAVKQKSADTVNRATATSPQVQRSAAAATARVQPSAVRVAPRIQPSSLRVSSPGDSAEKEADSTAKKVVGMSIPDRAIAFVRTAAGGVFRQIAGKDKERDERERMKQGPGKWQSPQVARFADTGLFRRPLTADEEKLKREGPKPQKVQPPQVARFAFADTGLLRRPLTEDEERLKREGPKPQKVQPPQVARFADTGLFRRPLTADEEKLKREGVTQQPLKIARFAAPGIFRSAQPDVQRKAEGMPNLRANVSAEIQAAKSGGSPLPLSVRRFMEPRFKADFSKVKVHTGDRAAKLNRQVNAKAFAVGGDVFFGKGQFRPETGEGRELIAHELTHTIQQGAAPQAVQRSEDVTVSQSAPEGVQRLGISDALDRFADLANNIPGYRMLTIILGVNPINMGRVERSAANIMRGIVEFIPGGGLITKALDNYGVFDKVGAWVEQQIASLGMTGSMFKNALDQFLDSLSWTDILDLGGVWNRAKRIFTEPVDRLISFAKNLITGILRFIRDAILRPLAGLAQGTRGYDLLKAILGQDPITGDPVPRTAETLIGGFMKFIGQEEVWENIKKGNAIPRAWAWFQESLSGLTSQVRAIPGKFMEAVQSLTLEDIVVLPRAFGKVASVFLGIIGGFFSWAGGQVMKLLEIVFDVVSPGAMGYIKKTGAALLSILKNPLPFVGNLVKAAKAGFQAFAGKFGTHLKAGLINWLTGSLPGIYIPKAFNLGELVKFVFSALGLTWANVRGKLVKAIGETAVKVMETGFDIVVTLVTQGPAAAWDKIKEALGSLQDMVVGGITDLVVDAVTKKAIPKLLAMFIPGAGFISAILSIYDTVMVFVSKISKIIEVVTGFINSIVAIAAGNITAAAKRVEDVLAGLLTLAINFLAGFAGLGRISDKIMGVLAKVRAPIDKALDSLIAWIVGMARKLGKYVAQAGVPNDPNERLRLASRDAVAAARGLGGRVTAPLLEPVLGVLKVRYGLTEIRPYQRGTKWFARIAINPGVDPELVDSGAGGPVDQARMDALIYRALVNLSRRLYFGWNKEATERGVTTGPAAPPTGRRGRQAGANAAAEDAALRERELAAAADPAVNTAQQALAGLQGSYGRAARARPPRGRVELASAPNRFTALGHGYFVDQIHNNYVIPVGKVSGVVVEGDRMGPSNASVGEEYAYNARPLPMSRLNGILRVLGGAGGAVNPDELAMFLASMVAEPSRYSVAHITNLLAVDNPTPGSGSAFDRLAMTRGGTDPKAGRNVVTDPGLEGARAPDKDAPRRVTDRDLAIVKGRADVMAVLQRAFVPTESDANLVKKFEDAIEPFVRRAGG